MVKTCRRNRNRRGGWTLKNGGFRKRKNRRRKRRRRRKTRKRGSGTPPAPPKRRAGKPPPRTPTGEFPPVPKPRKRRSSKYYSARMNSPQTEQARRTVSKIIGNATRKATRKLVTRRHGLRREKAKGQVVPLDEIFDNTGRAPGTWSAETSGFSQLKPAVKGTRHKSSKLKRQDSQAFANNYASRHRKISQKGRKRAAVKGAVRALGSALAAPFRFAVPSRDKKRERAQRNLDKAKGNWDELLEDAGGVNL